MFKPLTQVLHEQMTTVVPPGLGQVFHPNMPMPEPEPAADPSAERKKAAPLTIRQIVLGKFSTLQPITPKMQRELQKRLSQALTICSEWDEWLAKCAKEITDELERQHRDCREQGRAQLKVVRDLQQRVQVSHNQIDANVAEHTAKLREIEQAQEALNGVSRWTSDEDCEALAQKVEAAKAKLREFLPDEQAAFEVNRRLANELEQAEARMKEISDEEIRLRHAITGARFLDPELALSSEPGYMAVRPEPR